MGSDPKALLRSLVAVVVLAAAGFGLPARAVGRSADPGSRVAILPLPGPASGPAAASQPVTGGGSGAGEVRLPFPATHVGLRWRGSEADNVEIRWRGAGDGGGWRTLPIWDDAGDPDVGLVASGLVRPEAGATRLAVRWPAGVTQLEVVVINAGRDRAPVPAPPSPS